MKTQKAISAIIAKACVPKKESFYKMLSVLITNNLFSLMGEDYNIQQVELKKPHIKELVSDLAYLLSYNLIESRHVKTILETAWSKEWYEWDICWYLFDSKILEEASQDELIFMVNEIIKNEPKILEDLIKGKKKATGHIIGQIMKKTQGKANPQEISKIVGDVLFQKNS